MTGINQPEVLLNTLQQYSPHASSFSSTDDAFLKDAAFDHIPNNGFSISRICRILLFTGEILEQDDEKQQIILSAPCGILHGTRAFVVITLTDDTIFLAAYVKEGFIRQNMAEQVINDLKSKLSED